jgi:hypothetical protein
LVSRVCVKNCKTTFIRLCWSQTYEVQMKALSIFSKPVLRITSD